MFSLKNLTFGFSPNAHTITDDVSLASITFFVGVNGSGKTSLLKTFAGLLTPQNGEIKYSGKVPPLYLPAYPESSDWLTAEDIFEIFSGGSNKWQNQDDINELGIGPILTRPIHQLSLGEQKRIFLVAALRSSSDTLLLDEPLNSLDWNMEFALLKIIERHQKEGRTFLIAAHQLQWIARFKNPTVWFLNDFSRLKSGTTDEVLLSQEVQSVFNFRVSFTDNPLDGSRLIATSDAKRKT